MISFASFVGGTGSDREVLGDIAARPSRMGVMLSSL